MLRDFVQASRSGGVSAEHIEAVTAERDFFREKYAEQIEEMERLRSQLKDSQRTISKLRGQVLDLEVGRQKAMQRSGSSADTSLTCTTDCDDHTSKSSAVVESAAAPCSENDSADGLANANASEADENPTADPGCSNADTVPEDDDEQSTPEGDSHKDESDSDDDEAADNIRANAERMLLWANYQTSKRSTPNTSIIHESSVDGSALHDEVESRSDSVSKSDIVYSLPASLDKRKMASRGDDDSSLGSSLRESVASSARSSGVGGKIGNFLKGMIDPPSESDSESEFDDDEP